MIFGNVLPRAGGSMCVCVCVCVCGGGGVPLGEPVTTQSPSVTRVTYLALKAFKMQPLNPRPLPILLMKVLFKILVTKLIYPLCATEGYQRRRLKGTQYHQEK